MSEILKDVADWFEALGLPAPDATDLTRYGNDAASQREARTVLVLAGAEIPRPVWRICRARVLAREPYLRGDELRAAIEVEAHAALVAYRRRWIASETREIERGPVRAARNVRAARGVAPALTFKDPETGARLPAHGERGDQYPRLSRAQVSAECRERERAERDANRAQGAANAQANAPKVAPGKGKRRRGVFVMR